MKSLSGKKPEETRLLVVDDDPSFRQILAFHFKRKGYQVTEAASGHQAYEVVRAQTIDAVISDIRMPDGDGVEFLDRTREDHLEAPVILLVTGFADITTEEAHNKGAEALFRKPFDCKTLEETLQRLLVPSKERWTRESDRIDVELNVELQFQALSDAIEAKVVSIGRGGMFVTIENGYPTVDDEVLFKISFDGTRVPLSGNGIVRWVRTKSRPDFPSGCGIEFTFLGEAERNQILSFLEAKRPKAYIPNK